VWLTCKKAGNLLKVACLFYLWGIFTSSDISIQNNILAFGL